MLEETLEIVRGMSAMLDRMYARERRSERTDTRRFRRTVVHTDEGVLLVDAATGHVVARLGERRSEADNVIRDAAEVFEASRD